MISDPGLPLAAFLALLLSLLSYRLRFLTSGGAAVQWLMGVTFLGLGGWQWTIPILTFFLLSSLVSLVRTARKNTARVSFSKTSRRDAYQVLANGGIPWIAFLLFLLLRDDLFYLAHVGSIAAATADTWGTELGTLVAQRPRLLTTFRTVEPGRSGGVTAAGTAAGACGAVLVGLSALTWTGPSAGFIPAIALSGVLASAVDSLSGTLLQSQWRCANCDRITEKEDHCGEAGRLAHGYAWISNDVVNAFCTLSGALFSPFFGSVLS